MTLGPIDLRSRLHGALLGLAAGDALGSTVEFLSREEIASRHGQHRDLTGGGMFGWRPGQGTDDTDQAVAIARVYADGYSLKDAADALLGWYRGKPRDIGNLTRTALALLDHGVAPDQTGAQAAAAHGTVRAAGNGSLMRALATGLARPGHAQRRAEATEISAITHADPRCVHACVAYCDLTDALLRGIYPHQAVAELLASDDAAVDVQAAAALAGRRSLDLLPTSGYVLDSFMVAVWAILQPATTEQLLIAIVNRGGDADTIAAVAGGLLGARDGIDAIPERWTAKLEYAAEIATLAGQLTDVRTSP